MKKEILLFITAFIANTPCWSQRPSDLQDELLRQYEGEWVTIDSKTANLTKIIISNTGDMTVHAFGNCHPEDCDIGITELHLVSDNVDKNSNIIPFDHGLAIWNMNYAIKIMKLWVHMGAMPDRTQLYVETTTIFKDNSGRSNYHHSTIMRKVN